jgi:hypothetical protein
VHAGAKVVGGCCGTTPEHIRAMCEFVRPLSPRFAQPGEREPKGARYDLRRELTRREDEAAEESEVGT